MTTKSRYDDSCLLSKSREKRNENSPDYYGQITFSEEMIRYLAGQLKDRAEPTLRVALWRKENDRGVYLSMQLSKPRSEVERGGGGGGRRLRPASRPRDPEEDDLNDEIPF